MICPPPPPPFEADELARRFPLDGEEKEDFRPNEGLLLCSFGWLPELVPGRDLLFVLLVLLLLLLLLLLLFALPFGAEVCELPSDFDEFPHILVEKKGMVP